MHEIQQIQDFVRQNKKYAYHGRDQIVSRPDLSPLIYRSLPGQSIADAIQSGPYRGTHIYRGLMRQYGRVNVSCVRLCPDQQCRRQPGARALTT